MLVESLDTRFDSEHDQILNSTRTSQKGGPVSLRTHLLQRFFSVLNASEAYFSRHVWPEGFSLRFRSGRSIANSGVRPSGGIPGDAVLPLKADRSTPCNPRGRADVCELRRSPPPLATDAIP